MKPTVVLKLGGALLTDKSKPYTIRNGIIEKITKEIRNCFDLGLIGKLVVIHGVGSFGHPPVLKYNLHRGYENDKQLLPLSKTQNTVDILKLKLIEGFQNVEVPIIKMYTSSMCIGEKMKIINYMFDPLKGFLSLGMVPLLGGDMMFDREMGFSVCSGDQIAITVSREIKADYLIFATDVKGVYDKDPKIHSDAQLIRSINVDKINDFIKRKIFSSEVDASGEMIGKLKSIKSIKNLIKEDLTTIILSMIEKNNLKKYLSNKNVLATEIT